MFLEFLMYTRADYLAEAANALRPKHLVHEFKSHPSLNLSSTVLPHHLQSALGPFSPPLFIKMDIKQKHLKNYPRYQTVFRQLAPTCLYPR